MGQFSADFGREKPQKQARGRGLVRAESARGRRFFAGFPAFFRVFALNRLFLHVLDFFEGRAAVGAPAIGKIAALFRAGVINTAAVVSAEEFASAVRGFFQG